MTRDELLVKLRDLNGLHDPEADHGNAEDWLLEYLDDPEIKAAWNARQSHVGWWYA